MKIQGIIQALAFLSILPLMFSGCEKDDDGNGDSEAITITLQDPSAITETGFVANWSIDGGSAESILVQVAGDKDFKDMIREVAVADPNRSSQEVDGLHGASDYYHRIKATHDDGSGTTSDHKQVRTGYQSESADVITSDGLKIGGDIYYLSSNPPNSPAMILMGHFSISNMWKGEDLFRDLLRQGYVCYVFSYRGHPGSDYWDIFPQGLTPEQQLVWMEEFVTEYASKDLEACYDHLRDHPLVDSSHVGLMGGSLGSNMSMYANNWPGIRVSVGLCTSRLGLEDAGALSNVLFVSSELDENQFYEYKVEAEFLYNVAQEPKKKIIIPGEFHGIDMLVDPSLKGQILEWIDARMGR